MDVLNVLEIRLAKLETDCLKLVEIGEFLCEHPGICDAKDEQLLSNELHRWTSLLSTLCFPEGVSLKECLNSASVAVPSIDCLSICASISTATSSVHSDSSTDCLKETEVGNASKQSIAEHPAASSYYCKSCAIELNSKFQYEEHLKGSRHQQKPSKSASPSVNLKASNSDNGKPIQAAASGNHLDLNVTHGGQGSTEKNPVLLKSKPIPSVGNKALRVQLFWQLKVKWPHWARQVNLPLADSKPNYWCFLCPCLINPGSDGRMCFVSVASDLLSHVCSRGHEKAVAGWQDKGLGGELAVASGRFFQEENAACLSVAQMVTPDRVIQFGTSNPLLFQFDAVDASPSYTTVIFQLRNVTGSDVILRYECCRYNCEAALVDFAVKSAEHGLMHSMKSRTNLVEFNLQPQQTKQFEVSVLTRRLAAPGMRFGLFFLVATPENQCFDGTVLAEPLVLSINIAAKIN